MTDAVRLFVIAGSHPSLVAERGLELKDIAYDRVVLQFGPSMLQQKARFGRRTVPGMQIGAERVSGSRMILRAVEGLVPEPSLYPADPEVRREHDAAERWGDLVFQEAARWLLGLAFRTHPEQMTAYTQAGPPVPPAVTALGVRLEMRLLGRTLDYAHGELAAMPGYLDRIEAWQSQGLLGTNDLPTAAGLQLGASLRMLATYADVAPLIRGRPLEAFARAHFPDFPHGIPAGVLTTN